MIEEAKNLLEEIYNWLPKNDDVAIRIKQCLDQFESKEG